MRALSPNLRGAAFMILSMAGFALEDLFLKSAARQVPVGQISLMVGLCGMAFFAALSLWQGRPPLPRAALHPVLALRSLAEIAGRLFYALAIALTPLSSASAILQATPILVVLGAALIFGERVGAFRWLMILAGFGGVLLIVRPGASSFDALSLLAVAGMAGFAARDLATRAAPKVLSDGQLGFVGFGMLSLSGAILLAHSGGAQLPDAQGGALIGATAVFGLLGYSALTRAMRTGEVAAVTPFRYTRLLFAMALGALVLGEAPDGQTLLGAAIIVLSGLCLMLAKGPARA